MRSSAARLAFPRPAVPARPAPEADLGAALSEVTFVVIDLETTGTTPGRSRIIEVGAAKYRGGKRLGTFETLVDPGYGCEVPPFVAMLTGISEALLLAAPPIEVVLPPLLDFVGDAVLVGHNLRFDTAFLDVALRATGRPGLAHVRVDTLNLARRLLPDEVPDRRLSTLAGYFQTGCQPSHRALDDALATADVLHALLERASPLGVSTLGDLLAQARDPRFEGHGRAGRVFAFMRVRARRVLRLRRRGARSPRPGRCPCP